MSVRAVLLDIDGTLVDSNELHVTAWQAAFAAVGARFARQVIHDQIGKGADMLVPALLSAADRALRDALRDAHGARFKDHFLPCVVPFPEAHALLARVHAAGKLVALATSASAEEVDHYLELLDARDLVDATTSADDVEHTKPAPDIFAAALDRLSPLAPGEAIVVGDTPYDIEAARACGIAAIALRSGRFSDDALLEAGPIALYDDAAALLADFDRSPLGG